MRPLELELENFLSYRDNQVVDFRPVHVACLSGENGHGKSAILDAITWALWGEARKSAGNRKPDDDILNRHARRSEGATEMKVRLRFEAGGEIYEVVRTYRESASGKTTTGDLQFYYLSSDSDEAEIKDRTAGKMRETQSFIDEVLPVEYETFVNTAFLVQGESDSFTKKSPAERKEVLSKILQLGSYEAYRQQVRDEIGDEEAEVQRIEGQIQQLQESLECAGDREKKIEAKRDSLGHLKAEVEAAEAKIDELEEVIEEKREAARSIESLESQKKEDRKKIRRLNQKISGVQQDIEELQALTAEAESIRENAAAVKQAEEKRKELEKQQSEYNELKEDLTQAEYDLESAKDKRKSEISQLESDARRIVSELEDLAGLKIKGEDQAGLIQDATTVVETRLEDSRDGASRKKALEEEIDSLEEDLEDAQSKRREIERESNEVIARLEQISEEIGGIQDIDSGSKCPSCGQVVSSEHLEETLQKLREKRADVEEEHDQIGERLSSAEEEVEQIESALSKARMKYRKTDWPNPEKFEKQLTRVQELEEELHEVNEKLENTSSDQFAPDGRDATIEELQNRVGVLESELEEHPYDAKEHHQILDRIDELGGARSRLSRLEQAETELKAKTEQLADLEERAEDLVDSIDRYEEQMEEYRSTKDGLSSDVQELSEAKSTARGGYQEISQLQSEIGVLESELESDEEARQEIGDLQAKKETLAEDIQVLGHLKEAFSKHGIPSLIIENVLPSIEASANQLLDRLTGGEMSVRLETTREKQSGGTADTLEVVVEDRNGVGRPYETFSGGEGFRIDFALRVALSRVLAQRSGSAIDMLVVDEGFGTQDDDGLQAVQESVSEVAGVFDVVLVVTHLEALKDSFPQKLEVRKPAGKGSRVRLVQ